VDGPTPLPLQYRDRRGSPNRKRGGGELTERTRERMESKAVNERRREIKGTERSTIKAVKRKKGVMKKKRLKSKGCNL
jgi:hypothetical protein